MPTLEHTWLGSIEMSPHLLLLGIYTESAVAWEDKRTLGGVLKTRPAFSVKGRKFKLDGNDNYLTADILREVLALINAAQPVLLVHHQLTAMVRVDAITNLSGELVDIADYCPELWGGAQIELTEIG